MLWIENLQSYCVIFPTATKGSTDAPGKGKQVFPERLEATLLALLLRGSSQVSQLRSVEIMSCLKVMPNCHMIQASPWLEDNFISHGLTTSQVVMEESNKQCVHAVLLKCIVFICHGTESTVLGSGEFDVCFFALEAPLSFLYYFSYAFC